MWFSPVVLSIVSMLYPANQPVLCRKSHQPTGDFIKMSMQYVSLPIWNLCRYILATIKTPHSHHPLSAYILICTRFSYSVFFCCFISNPPTSRTSQRSFSPSCLPLSTETVKSFFLFPAVFCCNIFLSLPNFIPDFQEGVWFVIL